MARMTIVVPCLVAGLALAACGGSPAQPQAPASAKAGPAAKVKLVTKISPSRLLPEVDIEAIQPWISEHGEHKLLVSGLRITHHDNGTAKRADERFPAGSVRSLTRLRNAAKGSASRMAALRSGCSARQASASRATKQQASSPAALQVVSSATMFASRIPESQPEV